MAQLPFEGNSLFLGLSRLGSQVLLKLCPFLQIKLRLQAFDGQEFVLPVHMTFGNAQERIKMFVKCKSNEFRGYRIIIARNNKIKEGM